MKKYIILLFTLIFYKTMFSQDTLQKKYQQFQEKYGYLPASDKDNLHRTKSRMLQGIYRNQKIENIYCNNIPDNDSARSINFMRNKKLLNDAIAELEDIKKRQRLTDENRLMTNLLSSQPMAFNLFLPLKWDDYSVATVVFQKLLPQLNIKKINKIRIEYVPGDENGKNNRIVQTDNSCCDVYIEYKDNENNVGGIGVEVKYTDTFSKTDFNNIQGEKQNRYLDAINDYKNIFKKENTKQYLSAKYNQLFRNQLVVEEVKAKCKQNCIQLVVHSSEDTSGIKSINEFALLINNNNALFSLTIEKLIDTILNNLPQNEERIELYKSIYNRYCNYSLLTEYLKEN